jgi:1-acyl-sn-glycerol-3-phosphate acyltransferase
MGRILARAHARFDAADRCARTGGKLGAKGKPEGAAMPALDPDDPRGRDPAFIRDVGQPFCDWLRRRYFRTEIEGLEHVPRSGSFIAVANHSGGPMLPDIWLMVSYFWELFGIDAPSYALVHDAAFRVPYLRDFLIKIGALRASRRNAEKVLAAGGVLLITPGGDLEALRSFWRRNQLELAGHSAFVGWAFRHGVPVLPVVNVGAHEVYFTLFSSRALAKYSGLERLTRVKTVPLNVGLPWGIWLTGFLPFLPLPAKISFMVGKPVSFPRNAALAANSDAVQRGFVHVGDRMQGMLDQLASRRRLPVIG